MKTLLLFLSLALLAHAAPSLTPVGRITLLNGRILKNVVIRSYDAQSSKVLLLSEGKALLIPITLLPPPYAEKIQSYTDDTLDLVQTTPVPAAPETAPAPTPPTVPANSTPAPSAPATPAPASPAVAPSADPVKDHEAVAAAHVRRYYKFVHRSGANSISVTETDLDIDDTEAVTGWTNRYRTTGKVYLEIYDSIGGGSFRRGSGKFEVLTEQKPGERIKVIDFTRK